MNQDRIELYYKVLSEAGKVFEEKDKRYNSSFSREYKKWGGVSAAIRLNDKISRYETLIQNPEIGTGDESIKDTLIDLANYALMTAMEIWNTGMEPTPVDDNGVSQVFPREQTEKELSDYNKEELTQLAGFLGVALPKKTSKQDIINSLCDNHEHIIIIRALDELFYSDVEDEDEE